MKARIVLENPLTTSSAIAALPPAALDPSQEQAVILRTESFIAAAGRIFNIDLLPPAVKFDLRGLAAGMFRTRDGIPEIRFNSWIFARWYDEHLEHTVPHEVAHYVVHRVFKGRRVKPHGAEWRAVMAAFGLPPRVTCSHRLEDIADLPHRRMRRYDYACDCTTHRLSAVRHNRVLRGQAAYVCRRCRQPLRSGEKPD